MATAIPSKRSHPRRKSANSVGHQLGSCHLRTGNTGPCTVASLPGEHLFQASALPRNRMRPAIFHAFGKAKVGAQDASRELEQQGWETLPIAILGMPNLPPAWVIETWKPVGGCKFTGYFSGAAGNSALRFCLLLKWRVIRPRATELFPAHSNSDSQKELKRNMLSGDAHNNSCCEPTKQAAPRFYHFSLLSLTARVSSWLRLTWEKMQPLDLLLTGCLYCSLSSNLLCACQLCCGWDKISALIPLSGLKPLRYTRQPSPTKGRGIAPTIPVLHNRTLQPK